MKLDFTDKVNTMEVMVILRKNQSVKDIEKRLLEEKNESYKSNVIKMGIPAENVIGVSTNFLRKYSKELIASSDKDFIHELWDTDIHEMKMIAILLMDSNLYSINEMDGFFDYIDSWDLCDLFCKEVIINRKDYHLFIHKWINSPHVYKKRASYTLISAASINLELENKQISDYAELIQNENLNNPHVIDNKMILKSISWAIRELGKRNHFSKNVCIDVATIFFKTQRKDLVWIGKDSLKELELLVSVPERKRLISVKSKMGQKHYPDFIK